MQKPIVIGNFEINLNGRIVPYSLKRSSIARLLRISINTQRGLSVTIPSRYSTKDLPEFLQSKSSWILKHLATSKTGPGVPESKKPRGIRTVPYLGQKLKVVRGVGGNNQDSPITIAQDRLLINLPSVKGAAIKLAIARWLIDQSVKVIGSKVKIFCERMGLKCRRVTIRNQKTRWGSCSRLQNLSFNWRIIMAPEKVVDYVVIHELCHLKEMSHSKSFWALVAGYCPQWHEHRRWLNAHTTELNAQFQF
jgi:predicted metal-dependent hydrolase